MVVISFSLIVSCIFISLLLVIYMSSDHTKTLAFIEDYRSFTALWDVSHKDYTNKIKRNALNALATNYKTNVKEVKNKI